MKAARGCPGWSNKLFVERDTFIAFENEVSGSDEPVALAYSCGDVGDLVAAGLPLAHGAPKPTERLQEERLDVVWLEPPCRSPLHVLADTLQTRSVDDIVDQRPLFQKILQLVRIEGVGDDLGEARALRAFRHTGRPR
jgi:hypothetical protein